MRSFRQFGKQQDAVFENATKGESKETIRAAAEEIVNFAGENGISKDDPCSALRHAADHAERSISADDARCREIQNGARGQRRLTQHREEIFLRFNDPA